MVTEKLKENLIKTGVRNLQEYGYTDVTPQNLLTDEIYKAFFISMLKDKLGYNKEIDKVINLILSEIDLPNDTSK